MPYKCALEKLHIQVLNPIPEISIMILHDHTNL